MLINTFLKQLVLPRTPAEQDCREVSGESEVAQYGYTEGCRRLGQQSSKILNIIEPYAIRKLNPLFVETPYETGVLKMLWGSLWRPDVTGQHLEYVLAESVTVEPVSPPIYHVKLKAQKWSDDVPLTAADVAHTFLVTQQARHTPSMKDVKVVVHNDQELTFELAQPASSFLSDLSNMLILPKHKPDQTAFSGPYMLLEAKADQYLKLQRNPNYPIKDENGVQLPYIDRINVEHIPDTNVALLKMAAGEGDVVQKISAPDFSYLLRKSHEGAPVSVYDAGEARITNFLYLNLNPQHVDAQLWKIFSDGRFRQALSYGINRQLIVDNIFNQRATVQYCFSNSAVAWNSTCPTDEYNPEKAGQLLREMGLKEQDGKFLAPDGTPLTFPAFVPSEDPARVSVLQFISEDLKKVGIQLEAQPIRVNEIAHKVATSYDWTAVLGGEQLFAHPAQMYDELHSSARNCVWYPKQNAPATPWERSLDACLENVVHGGDEATVAQNMNYALALLAEEKPKIPLYSPHTIVAFSNQVCNKHIYPDIPQSYYAPEYFYFADENGNCVSEK